MRNRTSDLRIPRFNALPLSHRDHTVSGVYYEAFLFVFSLTWRWLVQFGQTVKNTRFQLGNTLASFTLLLNFIVLENTIFSNVNWTPYRWDCIGRYWANCRHSNVNNLTCLFLCQLPWHNQSQSPLRLYCCWASQTQSTWTWNSRHHQKSKPETNVKLEDWKTR